MLIDQFITHKRRIPEVISQEMRTCGNFGGSHIHGDIMQCNQHIKRVCCLMLGMFVGGIDMPALCRTAGLGEYDAAERMLGVLSKDRGNQGPPG